MVLAPACEWSQFPLQDKVNDGYFSPRTVIIHFLEKSYQEIQLKSHSNSIKVYK